MAYNVALIVPILLFIAGVYGWGQFKAWRDGEVDANPSPPLPPEPYDYEEPQVTGVDPGVEVEEGRGWGPVAGHQPPAGGAWIRVRPRSPQGGVGDGEY